tara:strand:- start:854 stop:1489 length:636 start_codon:yes stop_codon:yes gene_type:complete
MALGNKESGRIHNKTGSDLTAITRAYTDGKHEQLLNYEGEAAMLHQMQLMQNDIDELRRFVVSDITSGGGGGGSNVHGTTIKVLPNMFMSNDDANLERVMLEDDTSNNYSIRVGSSYIEMYAMVGIPEGKKATHLQVYASHTLTCFGYDVNYTSGAASSAISGNTNSSLSLDDGRTDRSVSSSVSNYFLIKVNTTSTSNKIYGAKLTIADI